MKSNETNPDRLNAASLEREMEWFNRVLEAVIQIYFEQEQYERAFSYHR